tara:strand:- start:4875 stop:5300 length:426 start_codon:yes stop_codon:yes gene_type:complete
MFMDKRIFKRVYHHYLKWEEIKTNMWGVVEDKKQWLEAAVTFTGNHELYGRYMLEVIEKWPISCENSLTNMDLNRKAWIGHAAVALAINCPENIVREAWGLLSNEQRLLANKKADDAIRAWERSYLKDRGIRQDVGEQMLF